MLEGEESVARSWLALRWFTRAGSDQKGYGNTRRAGYVEGIGSKTVKFDLTRTADDKDVPAAIEAFQVKLEEIKDRIPGVVMGEITAEPATGECPRPLRYTEVFVNELWA